MVGRSCARNVSQKLVLIVFFSIVSSALVICDDRNCILRCRLRWVLSVREIQRELFYGRGRARDVG